jgi:PAS domain S-box-containing protein
MEKIFLNDLTETILSMTGDGILITNSRGIILRANRAAEKILGQREQELCGMHAPELFYHATAPEGSGRPAATLKKNFFEPGPVENFQCTLVHNDGSELLLEINCNLIKDDSGTTTGTITSIRDISERQQAEKNLQASEERFRALAESLPEGIIAVDMQGKIVYWNTGAQNLFGYTKEEVLGMPSTLLIPERYHDADVRGLKNLQAEGAAAAVGTRIFSCGRKKDGTEFADEVSLGIWQTRQGRYYVAVIRDITERQQAEEALRASEKRFKELADALPQTVFELDLQGAITFVNRKALDAFGYAHTDVDRGLNALHMLVPEQRLQAREMFQRVVNGEQLGGHEYTALRKDGTTFPAIIHTTPVFYDGAIRGLRGLLVDITQRKEMEEEILKARKHESISALAGGVAQDFNNILSAILGNINLAQQYTLPEDKTYEHLAAAERATLRAKDLTDQLITFAKGGTGAKQPVAIAALLQEAAACALTGSTVSCDFDFPQNLWRAQVDAAQIKQVFINLVTNADHAMPEGGSIGLTAENCTVRPSDALPLSPGRYIKISVSDQSIGILNEHLQNIFDPYFTSRQRGSGIGLATTYTIIKNHNGLITVESEFGRGTTFFVYLPAA